MASKIDDQCTAYARAVLRKRNPVVAGPHVRASCRRHLDDLKEGPKRGLRWDREAAYKKIRYFRKVLRLNAGEFEGEPFVLEPWQCFIVGSLFGWKRKNGYRRFRTAFIEAGKGCGKTPLCAGIGLNMLCADGEERAEVYAAAYNHDQAKVLFRNAVAMVEQSPALSSRLVMSGGESKGNIAYYARNSFFRPISSERQGKGKSGPIPHCGLLDEVHEHATNAMVEFLDAGTKHRTQPLILMITNSGSDRQTVCWDYHQYAIKVADCSIVDDAFFSYVCALDKKDNPFKSEKCWIKANPGLPTIPGFDYIRDQVAKSKGIPSKETLCRRLNFCQWTDAADAWLSADIWKGAQAKLNLDDYKGRRCFGGLDLSISSDLTSLVLAFDMGKKHFDVFSWFWMPGDRLLELQERDNMAPRYQQWRDAGYLLAPKGSKVIDYEGAALLITKICNVFDVIAIAYDRAKIELLKKYLDENGCDAPLVAHGQGFYKAKDSNLWMPGSIEETESALINERLRINENPVLTWNVASAVTQQSTIEPADRYFAKRKASGRIDGAVALVEAIGVAVSGIEIQKSHAYQTRGFITL